MASYHSVAFSNAQAQRDRRHFITLYAVKTGRVEIGIGIGI